MTNVSRILALGGSTCCILRGVEAPGGPVEAGSDECLEDLGFGRLNVSYSTSLGGSRRSSGGWNDECLKGPGSGRFNV